MEGTNGNGGRPPLIECKNVTTMYGTYTACRNVSFALGAGDYLCIVGANGSGKTTLVKTILGLVPAKSGEIVHNTRQCGYLPQKSGIQRDFPATVREVVLSGTLCKGAAADAASAAQGTEGGAKKAARARRMRFFYSKSDKANAQVQIEKLGLAEIAGKSFRELSGGQQQRVLLARALCAAGELLVLDEPVTGLDPNVTDELYALIRKLNREDKTAVIMVSHDVQRALQNATHILHMDKTPLFFGTADEYRATPFYKELTHVEVCGQTVGRR